ncbi:chemotaxis protein CheR [Solimonas sp. K1W22B-7]|uniref:CheR family methyltransferase n=1 Tax=Solimonas sp. K1W22B-7 TaxID=2303331 RepID=UPI000E3343DE|nr:CheR family methyltransferase [Solimonas sp. K1W22B-7]AXQ28218.1 chemotaxis protein CheR [Solimonas sp. K1W22B-7]
MAVAEAREFAFARSDFERVRALIHGRAGISLAPAKRDMVYSRLVRRLRALHLDSFGDYLARLDDPDNPEWEAFTNALTTNLTAFFREPHHFEILAGHLRLQSRGETLRLWSSASSTGEEPYSMAMAAIEAFGRDDPPVRILATDVDTQVLAAAERGVYPIERIEKLDEERRRRFFSRGTGSMEGYCRVAEPLRRLVSFRPLNLLAERWPMRGPFHGIFCRNVMIYFDKPTQHRLLARLTPLLTPDGLLFAGHSESFFHAADVVTPCGRTVYRRTAKGGT